MDFKKELAKWGYNLGNSIDINTLIDEILPKILKKIEQDNLNNCLVSVEFGFKSSEKGNNIQKTISDYKKLTYATTKRNNTNAT